MFIFKTPNPNMVLIVGLAVFTSIYGYGSGIACGIVMLIYSAYTFSLGNDFFTYDSIGVQKMVTIGLGVCLNIIFIGRLKQVKDKANRELRLANRILSADNNILKTASMTD